MNQKIESCNDLMNQLKIRDNQMKPYECMINEITSYKEKYNTLMKENIFLKTKQQNTQYNNEMNVIFDKTIDEKERNKIFEKLVDQNILQQKLLSTTEIVMANNNKIKTLEHELIIFQKKSDDVERLKNKYLKELEIVESKVIILQNENKLFLDILIKEKEEKNKIASELLECESYLKMIKFNEKKLKDELFVLELEFNTLKEKC